MTSDLATKDMLRERLARLDADKVADLVLGLQARIDGLRAELTNEHDPIAIVGLACRLPHAESLSDYRRLLFAGDNAIGAPPADRPEAQGLPPAGYLNDIDRFDAGFFGFRAAEAAVMDPQHRLLMELSWHALEDAGYAERTRRPRHTGIYVGLSTGDYEERFRGQAYRGFTPQAITGNARSIAAGRLAHWLDTTGPALTLDTACSSSLVAIHIACLALRSGACDMAIAAGANALLEGDLSDGFEAAGMLSPDHACKTFDDAANGYVRGEGGGVIVVKRLSDAQRDGDDIRAVIRGGAINHDGHASALTAPNGSAQVAVIRAALTDAGLAPADVQAVECHGTGTSLGDPIEVQALAEAYGPTRDSDLLLGSVKTNIGHLEAAAGVAGLIKMVLALQAGRLPPTLHQVKPNPRIAWGTLPVRVVDQQVDWPVCAVRRGGVSSFGFSGTNAHIILEAGPEVEAEAVSIHAVTVLPLSAPDRDGVTRLAGLIAREMEVKPDLNPAEVAAALAIGRETFSERAAVACADRDDLIADLKAVADGGEPLVGARGTAGTGPIKIAFLFTGQGSQWSGMGHDLYQNDPTFKATVDQCAELLKPNLPYPLTALMFDPDHEEHLHDTAIAQPTLFVLEYALAKRLEAWGVVPDIMIGHSLGELVAACVAGVMTLEEALALTAERGRLMGSLPRNGAMAAVFAPVEVVEPLLAAHVGRVDIAAINGPEDTVISGETASVDAVCDALEAQEIGCQRLRVSHAFHSGLMVPVLEEFQQAVAGVHLSAPVIPVVSNVTATADAPFTDPAYWSRHIREPVRFADGMSTVVEHGATIMVEVGATSVLIGMAQRALAHGETQLTFVPTLRRNRPAAQGLGAALARLFVAGAPIDWPALLPDTRRAVLPGYPFADERHWTPRPVRTVGATASQSTAVPTSNIAETKPSSVEASTPEQLRQSVCALLARSLQLDAGVLETDVGLFELGVDSLALTEAVAVIERRWQITLSRQKLFEEHGSARRLIAHVVDAISARPDYGAGEATSQQAAEQRASSMPRPAPGSPPVEQSAGLSESAKAYLDSFSRDYVRRSGGSRRQRETYGKVLADSRAVAGFRSDTKAMLYPIIGTKGSGSHVTDLDGNDYVDITMGFGVQLFGHNPQFVIEAMQRHLTDQGLFMGPQASLAGEVAERISRVTGNDRVLFCNTGTEAVMTALRLARHTTGRTLVAMFAGSYHGHFDGTLARLSFDGRSTALAGGTPEGMIRDVLVLDYDDPNGSLEALERVANDLAAVIVEPVQSRRPSLQPREFLKQLRAFTEKTGAALVFDEVLLGFRVALGGAQAWADVQADLVTYGKIVGGGLPIGVVAGRQNFLDGIDGGTWPYEGDGGPLESRTFFAGTFNKNPLTMATSRAVLDHLEVCGPGLQVSLNERTAAFCERLNALFEAEHASMRVDNFASLFRFGGASDVFFNHLIQHGVYVWEGRTCFLSTAHTDEDLSRVEEAVQASVRAMLPVGLMASARPAAPENVSTTPGQRALWVLAAFSPETAAAYNQSLILDLKGPLDPAALARAVQEFVDRHDSLRSCFAPDGDYLTIHEPKPVELQEVELADADGAAADAWVRHEAARPFDLETSPLLRVGLLRLSPDHCRLVLIQPHIVTDGWSMQVLAVELGALYSAFLAGTSAALPPAAAYRVYAEYARKNAETPEAAAHWRRIYATLPPPFDLPLDRPRPKLQTYAGDTVRREVPATLSERLAERARALGCSLFSLCLAGYARLLAQLSGQGDLAVAIFSAGQPLVGERSLTGYCISTLPIHICGADIQSSRELVATTHRAMADALAYPAYPFSSLIKDLGIKRDPSRSPLTGVSFNLDRLDAEPCFDGLATQIGANAHGSVRWDLNWNMLAGAQGLVIEANFNTGLFDKPRVEDWASVYVSILETLSTETDEPAPTVPIHAEPEVETIAHRVAVWAAETPDASAVRDQSGVTSYAELDRLAASLAGRLAAEGIGGGDRVAFKLERGLGPIVVMLASGRIGAAFVPLDSDHPSGHHDFILRDSGARLLITEPSGADDTFALPVIGWRREDDSNVPVASAPVKVAPDDLAYVLYTSGSTGRPKGVMVPWQAVTTYATALLARLGVDHPTSFAMVTSFAADLGYTSVIGALWSGGTLHAIDAETARDPNRLITWLGRHPVDALKIVPTHMAALLEAPDARALLPDSALIFGGDVLTYELVDRIHKLGGTCRVFNHYGPTETTIGATMIEVTDDLRAPDDVAVPIGRPLDGYSVDIVADDGRLLSDGKTGEIRISGPGVAAGYVTTQGDDKARFGQGVDGAAHYHTGDLGRKRDNGVIEFAGRKDDMVKIRGHRVDPVGVAALLRTHPGVRDAAVLVDRPEGRSTQLVAAVASDETVDALNEWLMGMAPAAMCPARIIVLESLPLNVNGKLDRAALLTGIDRSRDEAAPTTGSGGRVDTMRSIWCTVLNAGDIGPDDDFFALGGDSIMAIQIAGRARSAGLTISPSQIFEHATPTALAAVATEIDSQTVEDRSPVAGIVPLTPIQSWFMDIEMVERNRWALTAVFDLPAATTSAQLAGALAALIDRHDALRTVLVDGSDVVGQQVVGEPTRPTVLTLEAGDDDADALRLLEDGLANRLIADLNLASGQMIAAGLINRPAPASPRLVVAAHHLIFDMVSWAIFAEDLEVALTNGPDSVPPVATAWSWWCGQLGTYAEPMRDQLAHWLSVEATGAATVPVDRPDGANTEGAAIELDISLDGDATHALSTSMAETYGLQTHEIVLAAIGRALVRWTGASTTLDLEGHGREPLDPSIDLSHTVGWFTTHYPLTLPFAEADDPHHWLVAIKEAIRRTPHRGMGYGILRHLADAPLTLNPEVSFNFVGEITRYGGGELALVRVGAGQERDPAADRPHLLAFTGWLDDGALRLRCQYAGRHEASTVTGLLHDIGEQITALAEHCAVVGSKVYTPGDFADLDFTQDELDRLVVDVVRSS